MTTIKLKNGSGAPAGGDLTQGEPALDLTNKRLYTEDSGGTVIEVGTNPGVDVTFADNRKAIFGAGSDLEIYHDGSHSYIKDSGTGDLRVLGENFEVRNPNNNKVGIKAVPAAQVELYHDNTARLATSSTGIDVTGTVTADSIAIDTDSIFSQAGSNRVGINKTSPSTTLDVGGSIFFSSILRSTSGGSAASPSIQPGLDGDTGIFHPAANNIGFSTLATERMRIDSSGRVGIGTDSPDYLLNLEGSEATILIDNTTGSPDQPLLIFQADLGTNDRNFQIKSPATDSASAPFRFVTGNSFAFEIDSDDSALVIDSNANVGIGTDSPSEKLEVRGTGSNTYAMVRTTTANNAGLRLMNSNRQWYTYVDASGDYQIYDGTANSSRITVNRLTGNVGIGSSSPVSELDVAGTIPTLTIKDTQNKSWSSSDTTLGELAFRTSDTSGIGEHDVAFVRAVNEVASSSTPSGGLSFGISASNANASEAMRIDSSGNVQIKSAGKLQAFRSDNTRSILVYTDNSASTIESDTDPLKLKSADRIQFETDGANERARIDNNGNLLVGTTNLNPHTSNTAADAGTVINANGIVKMGRNENPSLLVNRIGNDGLLAQWLSRGSFVGNISVTSTTATYNSASDVRLKDNIVDAPSASDDIDAIQVRSFDWKVDGSHQKYGMVAQELQTVAPDAVSGGDTEEDMMGVDYSKLVPMLVKEIQSLRARVAQLEND